MLGYGSPPVSRLGTTGTHPKQATNPVQQLGQLLRFSFLPRCRGSMRLRHTNEARHTHRRCSSRSTVSSGILFWRTHYSGHGAAPRPCFCLCRQLAAAGCTSGQVQNRPPQRLHACRLPGQPNTKPERLPNMKQLAGDLLPTQHPKLPCSRVVSAAALRRLRQLGAACIKRLQPGVALA